LHRQRETEVEMSNVQAIGQVEQRNAALTAGSQDAAITVHGCSAVVGSLTP
jgi:hypothetical protein